LGMGVWLFFFPPLLYTNDFYIALFVARGRLRRQEKRRRAM
jgi:hypothetical protein